MTSAIAPLMGTLATSRTRRFSALAAVLCIASCLPTDPSDAERVVFILDFEQPYRVPMGASVRPPIRISVKDQVLENPRYRFEADGIVRVDSTGQELLGKARGVISVRLVYATATGEPDTVFDVQVVVSHVSVDTLSGPFTRLRDSTTLTAVAFDAVGGAVGVPAFRWRSNNPQVATVDSERGVVTAVDEGTATITAEVDGVSGSASVTVVQVASAVRVAPELDTLRTVGRTLGLFALAFDSAGRIIPTARPRWSSSDTAVVRVNEQGLATARGPGTALVIARVGQAADTATVVVAQVLRYLFVDPSLDTLVAIDDTTRLGVRALDSLPWPIVPIPPIVWTINDTAIATVTPSGLVRAKRNGAVVITASSGPVQAFATVVVRQEVATARLSQDGVTLSRGDTVRLSAVGLDRNGHPVSGAVFTWRSENGCVATVDDVGLVKARGGGRTDIVAAPANAGTSDTVAVTVTGAPGIAGLIAFGSRRGIETICDDGSQRTLMIPYAQNETSGPPLMGEPSWSPDGTRIAFSRFEEMGFQGQWYQEVPMTCRVYTAGADGSEPRALPLYASQCNRYPAWSPDGQQIAFVWGLYCFLCGGTWSISVVNADGSNLRELLPHKAGVGYGYPTWSPDGVKLAFEGPSDSGQVIMVINADGSGRVNLTTHQTGRHYDQHPAWSPDGSALAFVRDGDIWIMNAEGTGARNLTSSPAIDIHPAWSPDGSRLVFVSSLDCSVGDWEGGEGGDCDLYVMNRDGTGLRQLTSTAEWEIWPSWRRTATR